MLNRVASLFRRRAYNIESLTVAHTEKEGVSRMTIVVDGRRTDAGKVALNLKKLVDVIQVDDITDRPAILHDLALIKVRIRDRQARSEILRIADTFQARVVDMCPDSALVELAGSERKIDTVVEAVRSHGILEMVRTGRVAMVRGVNDIDSQSSVQVRMSAWDEGGRQWQE